MVSICFAGIITEGWCIDAAGVAVHGQ
jgi:hypothetical protein